MQQTRQSSLFYNSQSQNPEQEGIERTQTGWKIQSSVWQPITKDWDRDQGLDEDDID